MAISDRGLNTGGRMPSSSTDEGGSTSTTDERVSPAEAEPAVLSAFHAAASQQLKRLMADGVQRDTASVQLMDKMLQHRAGEAAGLSGVLENIKCTSPQLQHVVSVTGYTQVQAAKTLLLKEEIGQLRRQGHGTTALIDVLQKRLRFSAQPSDASDENSSTPAAHQPHKKLKRDEDVPHELLWPPLHEPGLRGGLVEIGGGGLAEMRPTMKKRHPDDAGPPLHKRPKTRLPALPLEACDAPPPAPT